jgi:trehalose 6-phosphate phosphatase
MEHLFKAWKDFSTAVEVSSHVLLLSDYDGTLTPIVSRPEDALLSIEVKNMLSTLVQKPTYSVGIISGRSMEELKAMVSIDGIYYSGNHGLEIEGPHLQYISEPARTVRPLIKELARDMTAALENVVGVIIQDKGLSLSVHYRLISPEEENTVAETFRRLTRPLVNDGRIKVTTGKKVYEIRPPIDWHKGKAVDTIKREIKSALNLESILTVYLGDDTTDEDAFRTLHLPEGWGIYVGKENPLSAATHYLESVNEVEEFLARLIELR